MAGSLTTWRIGVVTWLVAVLAIAGVAPAHAHAHAQVWVPVWTASPAPDRGDGPDAGPLGFSDETVRQDMRLGASADALRFRISNELGTAPLVLEDAAVHIVGADGQPLPVRFDGSAGVTVPVGAAWLSDPVAVAVPALSTISLRLRFPGPAWPAVRRTPLRVAPGRGAVPDDAPRVYRQNVVSAVLARREHAPQVIVALGDSITEGATAGIGSEGEWPARLARRLEAACPGRYVVLNAGISGNRLLDAGRSPSALARLERDVLALPGVADVIVLLGINDIRRGDGPGARPGRGAGDVIAGYRQLIARLRPHGIRAIGATLPPFGGSARYEPTAAAARREINAFIREGGAFAAMIDFDAALRAADAPERLPAALTRDGLHPDADGHARMAAAIPLSLFGCRVP